MPFALIRRWVPAAMTALILFSGIAPILSPESAGADSPQNEAPAHKFLLRFDPAETVYYEIESEFRESGGVAPLLTYTATIKDRRSITQRANSPTSQPMAMPGSGMLSLVWECDRYEAREQSMKEEEVYDSHRHLFPPASMRELEAIAGSQTAFLLLPETGDIHNITLTPAPLTCPIPRRGSMGKTIERCTLTAPNMKTMLEALGASWFPKEPRRVGETWTVSTSESQTNIGAIHITTRCTLRSVRQVEGRDIALIDLASDLKLELIPEPEQPKSPVLINPATQPTTQRAQVMPPATSQPGQTNPASTQSATTRPIAYPRPPRKQTKDFKLEKGAFTGTVEYDLTRNRPIQVTLRKEISVAADVESPTTGKMQIRQAITHLLKIRMLENPPSRPALVGGRVHPKLTDTEKQILEQLKKAPPPATQPAQSPASRVPPGARDLRSSRSGPGVITGGSETPAVVKTKRPSTPQPRHQPTSRSVPTTRPAGRKATSSDRS